MATIFVIEPDPVLLTQYCEALRADDRQIVSFRTAALALKALNTLVPDVIVLELALPGHNGFEFLYELRSYSDTASSKVVVNSMIKSTDVGFGYVSMSDFGISAYLHKPESNLRELSEKVSEALS